MNIFLKLKHWQLFGILLGAFLGVQFIISLQKWTAIFELIHLTMFVLFLGVYFCWLYTLGVNLNKKLPDMVSLNLKVFNWLSLFLIVYLSFFTVFAIVVISYTMFIDGGETVILFGEYFFAFPLLLFLAFCFLYCSYFNAKSLKAVELQRPITFRDYAGIFLLFLLFPIGVWIIQPKVNKIFDEKLTRHSALDAESHRSGDCGSSPQ